MQENCRLHFAFRSRSSNQESILPNVFLRKMKIFSVFCIRLAILMYIQYFPVLQTLKLNNKNLKTKKSKFYWIDSWFSFFLFFNKEISSSTEKNFFFDPMYVFFGWKIELFQGWKINQIKMLFPLFFLFISLIFKYNIEILIVILPTYSCQLGYKDFFGVFRSTILQLQLKPQVKCD